QDIATLANFLADRSDRIRIGSLSGRFYAMDRDNRWERTEAAYRVIAGEGAAAVNSIAEALEVVSRRASELYGENITDEFFPPVVISPRAMSEKDSLLFWNFRSDRMRQIVSAFSQLTFEHFERKSPPITGNRVLCFTEYDSSFHLPVLFPTEKISNHLGAVVSQHGLLQLRVAETEKYPHVTYFLNGGEEELMTGEDRILVPSPRDVKTYDEKPEMSAFEVTERVLAALNEKPYSLIVLNFANGDMVGHTGNLKAAIRAVEVVDHCLGRILERILEMGGNALVIADHGNAEQMVDYETGSPHTAHTTFPVPAILISENPAFRNLPLRANSSLCDIAPTMLTLLHLPQPSQMTGQSLLEPA
ncbi:MAG: 2,3-bisphosphoglycerate-independent phosphoglycerate mutase, partial [Bdellovibrionales bacterium]|nr:2,3-bisphosphoglycerate-independent phosphoglycerate mutase [Bdellovibrionales bacterium]